jgi:hypothetical protein
MKQSEAKCEPVLTVCTYIHLMKKTVKIMVFWDDILLDLVDRFNSEEATRKFLCWFHYVADTFILWPHGQKLKDFLDHLNSIHQKTHLPKRRRWPP